MQTSEEKRAARKKAWIKSNPEKVAACLRKRHLKMPFLRLITKDRSRARAAGLDANLTVDWAKARWTGRCEVTNAPFVWTPGKQSAFSASIDRIDATKCYTQDNCRFVLWAVNRLKGDESDDVMRQIARLIVGH